MTLLLLQLFFAKVPRSASAEQIKSLFARFGEVTQLALFAEYPVGAVLCCMCRCSVRGAELWWPLHCVKCGRAEHHSKT
jgi:hypothetical protein